MKKVLQILLLTSVLSLSVYGQAIGDIRLQQYQDLPGYYEVLIYFTDGITPPDWGGICADVSPKTVEVLCQQLGFMPSGTVLPRDTGRSVWLKDVQCTGDETHILQCGYQPVTGSDRNGAISCDGRGLRQLIQCDLQRPTAYDGEIRLCPPDSTLNNPNSVNITSVSFGVVALNIEGQWRGIVQLSDAGRDGLLGSNEANAICRQLGFTEAIVGSAVARSATNYNFDNNCYSSPGSQGYVIQSHAWMTTKDVKCSSPQDCLECCYEPPETGCPQCNIQQDIVVQCTFDITKSMQTMGSQDKCKLNTNEQCLPDECSAEKQLIRDLRGGLGFFIAALLLIDVIAIICGVAWYCHKNY